jgi:ketosteroid isomerase-like protein
MSQANVEVVRRAIAAVNERDVEGYLACCTDEIQLETPWTPVEGVYEGPAAIRRFFSDLDDTAPDFRLTIERVEAIGADRVLAFLRASATGRASGIRNAGAASGSVSASGVPTANVYDLADGKINRIRIFLDREEALDAAGLRE